MALTIYGLVAAREPDRIRYVGATRKRHLCSRLTGHRYDARGGRTSPVCEWIRQCLAAGDDIQAVVLERSADPTSEAVWIDRLRDQGSDLLNARGGGPQGGSFDAASRERLAASNVRAFADPARRASRRGEASVSARLTEADVFSIRGAYGAGGVTQRALADRYGVDRTTIGKIVTGRLWGHLGGLQHRG